ncbi:MAG: hypothetical protein IAE81_23765 [Caldilineaceae bacterium]|jgi:hypothetical protein|nr:hypothetical protein [Caldilineaceae bacterium]
MKQEITIGEGAIYAAGIWLARVHYTWAENGERIALRVCDGERDLFAPPIPASELLLELADGSRHWFRPSTGNPVTGAYLIVC